MKATADLPDQLRQLVGGESYLWCGRCHRTFTRDQALLDDGSFDKAVALLSNESPAQRLAIALNQRIHCPHEKCGSPLDVRDWESVRAERPDFPAAPAFGQLYDPDEAR